MVSFPLAGNRAQDAYTGDGDLVFIPIVDSPGVAFIIADKKSIHHEVLTAMLRVWPYVLFLLAFSYFAGIIQWLLVSSTSIDHCTVFFIAILDVGQSRQKLQKMYVKFFNFRPSVITRRILTKNVSLKR